MQRAIDDLLDLETLGRGQIRNEENADAIPPAIERQGTVRPDDVGYSHEGLVIAIHFEPDMPGGIALVLRGYRRPPFAWSDG